MISNLMNGIFDWQFIDDHLK